MTRREIHPTRRADLALLRLVDEAKRRGLAREALALIRRAQAAEARQYGALGVVVRRRPH